ncbi:MAG TPA: primosomal protein N', partial [Thermoanaerobaculia bacterium]
MTSPLARVAVPLPLEPLTYEVPPALREQAVPGARVRVRVGRRRLTGVVVERTAEAPEGIALRPLEEVLDREPVYPEELLGLARFTADYYRAPLGEVLRTMLPGDLPPWGHQRVRLTP